MIPNLFVLLTLKGYSNFALHLIQLFALYSKALSAVVPIFVPFGPA